MAHLESTESPLHESSHLKLSRLVWFTLWFVVGLVVIHALILAIFFGFRKAVSQPREITGVEEARIPPPEPRLQPSVDHNLLPANDLARMREAEKAEFTRRGWVDEKTGEIRVPEDIATRVSEISRPKK